jgi:hypothetical protein
MRRRRRSGLLGDLDLDDLTPAHELGDCLARQANGVVPRRGFHPTRRQGRNGHLDTALGCLGENEGVLHRVHSSLCISGRLENTRVDPVMLPALRARIHDASLQRPTALPRADGPAAGAGGHAASRAVVVEAGECRAPRTYADGHGYNAVPMLPGDAAHGVPSEG